MKLWLSRCALNLVYALLLGLFSPLLVWQQVRGIKRRSNWSARILGPKLESQTKQRVRKVDPPLIWLHAVSVGEVNLLATLVPALRSAFPNAKFAISASTDTGLELAENRFANDLVFRFPFDFSWAISKIFRELQPSALILTELEIWPNTISLAHQQQVPVIVVNGRLSQSSFSRYQKIHGLIRNWFGSLACVASQTETYSERFVSLGVPPERVKTVGSMKFDAAQTNRRNHKTAQLAEQFGLVDQRHVWLAGSTSAGEEKMACEIFSKLKLHHPSLKLILVPRHKERFDEVARLVTSEFAEYHLLRRSSREATASSATTCQPWDILLVDTIGELSAWWGCADIGFVGGSFGSRGGQSMIEPAGYGLATCFGPNTSNFRDVVELLLSNQAGVRVNDATELQAFVEKCLDDEAYRSKLGQTAQQLVIGQYGATKRTVLEIQQTLASPSTEPTG